jgi:hypothetical protein
MPSRPGAQTAGIVYRQNRIEPWRRLVIPYGIFVLWRGAAGDAESISHVIGSWQANSHAAAMGISRENPDRAFSEWPIRTELISHEDMSPYLAVPGGALVDQNKEGI